MVARDGGADQASSPYARVHVNSLHASPRLNDQERSAPIGMETSRRSLSVRPAVSNCRCMHSLGALSLQPHTAQCVTLLLTTLKACLSVLRMTSGFPPWRALLSAPFDAQDGTIPPALYDISTGTAVTSDSIPGHPTTRPSLSPAVAGFGM